MKSNRFQDERHKPDSTKYPYNSKSLSFAFFGPIRLFGPNIGPKVRILTIGPMPHYLLGHSDSGPLYSNIIRRIVMRKVMKVIRGPK